MIELQFGENITFSASDKLVLIDLDFLSKAVSEPIKGLDVKTAQLRRVGGIDSKAYQSLKKELPYVTCGIFNPPFRKTENFASIQAFILDFDHLSEKETDPESLKQRLKADDRIALMFTSPGGDGLKVLFVLKEPFRDHGRYTIFYKIFIAEFARSYSLQQVIDKRTSDATRATFLCHDALAWYNPLYEEIDVTAMIDFESSTEVDEAIEIAKEQEIEYKADVAAREEKQEPLPDMPDETLEEIKRKLNPKYRPKSRKKEFYVPEKVMLLETEIRKRSSEVGIEVSGSEAIQYGKQISFIAGDHKGELNIFFGKRGFSVVKSTKTNCSAELTEIAYTLVMELIED